jgi:hypothetical protein
MVSLICKVIERALAYVVDVVVVAVGTTVVEVEVADDVVVLTSVVVPPPEEPERMGVVQLIQSDSV